MNWSILDYSKEWSKERLRLEIADYFRSTDYLDGFDPINNGEHAFMLLCEHPAWGVDYDLSGNPIVKIAGVVFTYSQHKQTDLYLAICVSWVHLKNGRYNVTV